MMVLSLSKRIFLYFFVVIIISLTTVGVVSYVESSGAIDEQVEKYFTTVINSALIQTDNELKTFERISDSVLSQQQLKKFLDMNPEDSYEYYWFTNEIRKNIFSKLYITYPTQINMIYILGFHNRAIFDGNQGISSNHVNTRNRMKELDLVTDPNGKISILSTSILPQDKDEVISVVRKIRGYSSYDVKGILAIEFNKQQLMDVWRQMDLGEGGFFFILDSNGEEIYSPDQYSITSLLQNNIVERIVNNNEERIIVEVDGVDRMIISRKSEYSGWSLAITMPLEELRKPIANIRSTTLIIGMITLVIALILAIRFGRSIVLPIQKLRSGMKETERGNWKVIEVIPSKDEIGGLMHSYNRMVGKLSEMIESVYHAELKEKQMQLELQHIQLERQKAEFQALQLQINPHFFYNTLETINCYAIIQESDDISEIVEAMAFMLRYSVQTNLEESTIVNELNHVRNYLIILKHRVDKDFELEVLIPPEMLLEQTVRLTLQPIVENIFQHAFDNGIEAHHYIRVNAFHKEDKLYITVSDNGAGISPERIQKLRQHLRENRLADDDQPWQPRKGGIGMLNVHRRIQMVYGDEYGILIDSQEGKGTTITMVMPKEKEAKVK